MTFYFLPLFLRLMCREHNVDWTVTFLLTPFFTVPISSAEICDHLPRLALAFSFHFPCYYFCCTRFCLCMVRIKFTARP
jgi:hypothetical protein